MLLLGFSIGIAAMVSVYRVVETMKDEIQQQMVDYGATILITTHTGELTLSYGGIRIPDAVYDMEQLNM